jgi:hypothetical protein
MLCGPLFPQMPEAITQGDGKRESLANAVAARSAAPA